jgi:hypothetical protein
MSIRMIRVKATSVEDLSSVYELKLLCLIEQYLNTRFNTLKHARAGRGSASTNPPPLPLLYLAYRRSQSSAAAEAPSPPRTGLGVSDSS